MASASLTSSVIVWQWKERPKQWIPYEANVCHFLEKKLLELRVNTSKKTPPPINLGECAASLDCYEVDLVRNEQRRPETGSVREIKRKVYKSNSVPGHGIRWEWHNDIDWVAYDLRTSEAIESEFSAKRGGIDLSRTKLGIPNFVDFFRMTQINKHTFYERPVQRLTNQLYPVEKPPSKGANTTATQYHTSSTSPSKSLKTNHQLSSNKTGSAGKKAKKPKVEHLQVAGPSSSNPLSDFCKELETVPDEDCAICFEKLCNISSFDESGSRKESQSSGIKQLSQCKHSFHAACLQAMYNSGTKDGSLQCPTCKAIYGVKHGNQPKDGFMTVQHSHHPLPGYPDCGMIIITYDFKAGVQGPEHPNPGKRYTARGFPRTCFLPDNQKGNKVLKLLGEAWRRRLIFTVATSSTTGEQDTVVWNEIHHKTEAVSNNMGHGYPDPNYLDNVLTELAAQGVQDEEENELQPEEGVRPQVSWC